jgi:hypothetical protein
MKHDPLKIKISQRMADGFTYQVSSDHMADYGFMGELKAGMTTVFTYDDVADLRDYCDEILNSAMDEDRLKNLPWLIQRLKDTKAKPVKF